MTTDPTSNSPESPIPPPPEAPPQVASEIEQNKDARTMGMLCHLLGILTWFIGPLIVWLIKKDESPFVDDQGKETLNWQITLVIGWVIAGVTSMICIGLILMPVLAAVQVIFGILGAVKANDGIRYRYPFAIRMIK